MKQKVYIPIYVRPVLGVMVSLVALGTACFLVVMAALAPIGMLFISHGTWESK